MPRRKPVNDVQAETAELLDRAMYDILKNGQKVVVGTKDDGTPIVETLSPSAAMLNVIRARIRDNGVQSPAVPGTAAGKLAKEFPRMAKPIPRLDENGDDATSNVA